MMSFKTSLLCAGALAMFAGSVQLAMADDAQATPPAKKAHSICLDAGNIDHLSYPDDSTILFHMRGGKVRIWKNTLKRKCPNMKFQGGIAYEIRGGTICSNMQTFYVIRYWNPCMLGEFTPYTPPKKDDADKADK